MQFAALWSLLGKQLKAISALEVNDSASLLFRPFINTRKLQTFSSSNTVNGLSAPHLTAWGIITLGAALTLCPTKVEK